MNGPEELLSMCITKRLSSDGHQFKLAIDLALPAGITILFGPSGSGKTTVLNCIAGLLRPDEGRITIGARVLYDSVLGAHVDVAERDVGYVFQELALFPHLTVEQNVQYGLAKLPAEVRRERTRGILESFRVAHLMHAYPRNISGGEQQRVALARSLVTMPRVLLLDEPLSGLDAATKQRIIGDLREWNKARSIPILYVTHTRDEVFALGETVVCLDGGEVIAQGAPHEVLNEPRHETVAQLAGFENFFDARVAAGRERHGVMTCQLDGSQVKLEVPYAPMEPDSPVRIAVRAGDILVATERPSSLSARNIIPGRLMAMDRAGTIVVAKVDCGGARMTVNLTPSACESLSLQPGREVWLVIKTHSCHLVEPGNVH